MWKISLTKSLSYKQNGILHMLDRNRRIKLSPQRFQDEFDEKFDIVITAEERVYDQVIEGNFIPPTITLAKLGCTPLTLDRTPGSIKTLAWEVMKGIFQTLPINVVCLPEVVV